MRRFLFALALALLPSHAWAWHKGNNGPAYPCSILLLDSTDRAMTQTIQSWSNAANATTYYGAANSEATVASAFFAASTNGGHCTTPIMKVVRFPVTAARAHLNGGNLAPVIASGGTGLTPATGTVVASGQGDTWTSSLMTLVTAGTASAIIQGNATALQAAINGTNFANLPVKATTTGSTMTPASCQFTGYLSYITVNVTNNGTCGSAGPPLGSQICDGTFNDSTTYTSPNTGLQAPSCVGGQIVAGQQNMLNSNSYRNNTTTQNVALTPNLETFSQFLRQSSPNTTTPGTTIHAYWEVLTVGTLISGTIRAGQQLVDNGGISATNICVIWSNISGAGNGSTWLVSCVDPTLIQPAESISLTDCSEEVINTTPTAGTAGRTFLLISSNNFCPFGSTSIGYFADGSANIATQLGLTAASGGIADSPGFIVTNASAQMNTILGLDPNFGDFFMLFNPWTAISNSNYAGGQVMPYGVEPDLQGWSQTRPGQWPYYHVGWWATTPPGANFPWAQ